MIQMKAVEHKAIYILCLVTISEKCAVLLENS